MPRSPMRSLMGLIAFGVVLFVGLWHLPQVTGALRFLLRMVSFCFIGGSLAFLINVPMRIVEGRLFDPLNRRLGKVWARVRRPLALLITLLLVLALLALVVFMVIPELINTITLLAGELPGFIDSARLWLNEQGLLDANTAAFLQVQQESIDWEQLLASTLDLLRNGMGSLVRGTVNAASTLVSGAFSGVVGIILALYILMGKERLSTQAQRALNAYVRPARAGRILEIGRRAVQVFSSFITGQFAEAVILGLMFFVGMSIFRFPFAPMVSMLVGVASLIPIFGAFLGAIVGTFMILINQGLVRAAWFVLFFIVMQQIEGNLIYPHVVGKSVMLPGLWVLVAVTLGGNLFGIMGMLIGVPLCALLYSLARDAVDRREAARAQAAQVNAPHAP